MQNTITIDLNGSKITVTPSERMEASIFRAFRSDGWLWSGRAGAFVFNDNENGARRVRRLMNGGIKNFYGLTDDGKAEAAEMVFAYADPAVEQHFAEQFARMDEQRAAENARKEQAAEQAAANKIEQIKKILDATKDMPNGFAPALSYGFALPITTTKDFFERGGVAIQASIPALCKQLQMVCPAGIDDSDILTLKIEYDFCEARRSWWDGNIIPARRNAVLRVTYQKHEGDGVLVSHSGSFDVKIILKQDLKQRTLAAFRELAKICDDDVKRAAVDLFFDYCAVNRQKDVAADIFAKVPGNGSITLEQLRQLAAA